MTKADTYAPSPLTRYTSSSSVHHRGQARALGQHVVDDRLDQGRHGGRRRGIHHHGRERHGKSPAIRPGVPEQAVKRIHSVNRYFSSTHSATKPSRQVIFLPSS